MENDNIQITDWTPSAMLEVTLHEPDDFLKIRETLTRIGVASKKDQKLFQSCHILHKQGRYFIVHFKELSAYLCKERVALNDSGHVPAVACVAKRRKGDGCTGDLENNVGTLGLIEGVSLWYCY